MSPVLMVIAWLFVQMQPDCWPKNIHHNEILIDQGQLVMVSAEDGLFTLGQTKLIVRPTEQDVARIKQLIQLGPLKLYVRVEGSEEMAYEASEFEIPKLWAREDKDAQTSDNPNIGYFSFGEASKPEVVLAISEHCALSALEAIFTTISYPTLTVVFRRLPPAP